MSLRQLILNLFTEARTVNLSGVGYAGTITIESGYAQISSSHFPECGACDSPPTLVRKCRSCGRDSRNNLSFLAGRGDGIYAGISLYVDNESAASIYIFDEDNKMAGAFGNELSDESRDFPEFQQCFLDAVSPDYLDLPAFFAGTINASFDGEVTSVGFVVGDAASSPNTTASVDHPFFNGSHSVYLFMEPILDSPAVQIALRNGGLEEISFNGGYKDAMRPRAALIVNEKKERKLLKSIETNKVDWVRQSSAWSQTLVAGNVAGNNAGIANYFNGLFWLAAANRQNKIAQESDFNEYMSFIQTNRAYGYFFAGALSGDEDSRQYVGEIINADAEPEAFLEPEILKEILAPRGLEITPEVLSLVRESLTESGINVPIAGFCAHCGTPVASEARFCSGCGAKRP